MCVLNSLSNRHTLTSLKHQRLQSGSSIIVLFHCFRFIVALIFSLFLCSSNSSSLVAYSQHLPISGALPANAPRPAPQRPARRIQPIPAALLADARRGGKEPPMSTARLAHVTSIVPLTSSHLPPHPGSPPLTHPHLPPLPFSELLSPWTHGYTQPPQVDHGGIGGGIGQMQPVPAAEGLQSTQVRCGAVLSSYCKSEDKVCIELYRGRYPYGVSKDPTLSVFSAPPPSWGDLGGRKISPLTLHPSAKRCKRGNPTRNFGLEGAKKVAFLTIIRRLL